MPPVPDPYRVLGVARGASQAEIKAAHRRLAKSHHPDAGGDATRFLAIQAAYQLLADPAQRRRWDATHGPGPVAADGRDRAPRGGAGRRRSGTGGPASAGSSAAAAGSAAPPWPEGGRRAGPSRDAASAGWTWSAEGVPWWDEPGPRGRGRRGRRGAASTGSTPGTDATPGAGGGAGGTRAEGMGGEGGPVPGAAGSQASGRSDDGDRSRGAADDHAGRAAETGGASGETGTGRARRGGARTQGTARRRAGAATEADDPRADTAPGAGDIYARSSGAAWSAASRAYFRRVAAEIPRGARMGHSSRTGRVGWEPSAEEIAQAVAAQERRRTVPRPGQFAEPLEPPGTAPATPPAGSSSADRAVRGPLERTRELLRRLRRLGR